MDIGDWEDEKGTRAVCGDLSLKMAVSSSSSWESVSNRRCQRGRRQGEDMRRR